MAKLIYSAIASADGYVEDAAGRFDWAASAPSRCPCGPRTTGHTAVRRWCCLPQVPHQAGVISSQGGAREEAGDPAAHELACGSSHPASSASCCGCWLLIPRRCAMGCSICPTSPPDADEGVDHRCRIRVLGRSAAGMLCGVAGRRVCPGRRVSLRRCRVCLHCLRGPPRAAQWQPGHLPGADMLHGFGPPMRYLQTACGAPQHPGGAQWFPDTITVTVPFNQPASQERDRRPRRGLS
jgi:hypothetical protein